MFTLKHHFTSKLSAAAVHEAFSNVYPDKGVLNMTPVHQLVTKFWVDACVQEDSGYLLKSCSVKSTPTNKN
jgi:hypothetical protein